MKARFKPVADRALLVEFASEASDAAHQAVLALDHAISDAAIDGVHETVPAVVNLLVSFDPLVTDHDTVRQAVQRCLENPRPTEATPKTHRVAVCYDPALAPDLPAVAAACGLSEDAVINAHLGASYQVVMYGFAPGYAYLGGVDAALRIPRKRAAKRDVPAGSVVIAGPQCLITTLDMPTGWSIIGRSTAQVLQPDPDRPFLFDVGDIVRFERIGITQFNAAKSAANNGG